MHFFCIYLMTEANPAYETLFPHDKNERRGKPDMHQISDTQFSQICTRVMTAILLTVCAVQIRKQTQIHALPVAKHAR
jgi:hypothetical protein